MSSLCDARESGAATPSNGAQGASTIATADPRSGDGAGALKSLSPDELLESIERAVIEVEALEAIYGAEPGGFHLISTAAVAAARAAVEVGLPPAVVPDLELEIMLDLPLPTEVGNACADLAGRTAARLRCRMPPGYPAVAAAHVSAEVTGLRRQAQTELSTMLCAQAKSLVGEEAIMQIVQLLQELGSLAVANAHQEQNRAADAQSESQRAEPTPLKFGRRWMVMGHIKATSRRAQMIAEAADRRVGGLIRPGYPGVCVVEGEAKQCDAFVRWAKDIWIGKVTVRGEVTVDVATSIDLEAMRKFDPLLIDLGAGCGEKRDELPSMGALGSACKEAGLDAEFLEFVMGRGQRIGAC